MQCKHVCPGKLVYDHLLAQPSGEALILVVDYRVRHLPLVSEQSSAVQKLHQ
jgi:hypothetical protein